MNFVRKYNPYGVSGVSIRTSAPWAFLLPRSVRREKLERNTVLQYILNVMFEGVKSEGRFGLSIWAQSTETSLLNKSVRTNVCGILNAASPLHPKFCGMNERAVTMIALLVGNLVRTMTYNERWGQALSFDSTVENIVSGRYFSRRMLFTNGMYRNIILNPSTGAPRECLGDERIFECLTALGEGWRFFAQFPGWSCQ